MNISGIGNNQPYSYAKVSPKSINKAFVNSLATQNKTDADQKQEPSNIWGELSKKYDVRNATFDDICKIADELYNAGQIPLLEKAIMTFDKDRDLRDMKAEHIKGVTASTLYLTPTNSNGRRDWIAEYEAKLKQSYTSSKPSTSRLIYQDILQILKRLDI